MKINNSPTLRLLASIWLVMAASASMQAQGDGLRINSIFEKYGKKKGSTMVVLAGEALDDYRMDLYRGITVTYDKAIMDDMQQCLDADKKQARQIKEVVSNGIITSGYYRLPEKDTGARRYILFKIGTDGTATLIYIEGGKESEELVNKLFIKKGEARQRTEN